VIVSFKHKGLKRLYEDDDRSMLAADQVEKIRRILLMLDNAQNEKSLGLPGIKLHPLKGNRQGFWSVTVKANWRIVFRFDEAGNAADIELIDYH
jgi:addiction module HigA family antidote